MKYKKGDILYHINNEHLVKIIKLTDDRGYPYRVEVLTGKSVGRKYDSSNEYLRTVTKLEKALN